MILSEAVAATGVSVYAWLDHEADVPVVTTAACQGDISIRRTDGPTAAQALPRTGAVLVRSEATSHTHTLHGEGVLWDAADGEGLALGTVTVPEGAEALICHQEHGALLLSPGTYAIGRQREWAGEWRMVAD